MSIVCYKNKLSVQVKKLRLMVFKHGEESFLNELDLAGVSYNRVIQLSEGPMNSGKIYEVATAISEAMPWNSLAKVIVAWINARSTREVIITTEEHQVFHAKGYSVPEIQKILSTSLRVDVIDTKPEDKK